MADIAITPANVIAGSDAKTARGTAGATITAGQVVYKDDADGRYKLADSNSVTPGIRIPVGIALHGASNGQPLVIAESGPVTIGGTLVANTAYYLSDTNPGGICPIADVGAGDYPALLGMSTSTTVLAVKIQIPGGAL